MISNPALLSPFDSPRKAAFEKTAAESRYHAFTHSPTLRLCLERDTFFALSSLGLPASRHRYRSSGRVMNELPEQSETRISILRSSLASHEDSGLGGWGGDGADGSSSESGARDMGLPLLRRDPEQLEVTAQYQVDRNTTVQSATRAAAQHAARF